MAVLFISKLGRYVFAMIVISERNYSPHIQHPLTIFRARERELNSQYDIFKQEFICMLKALLK